MSTLANMSTDARALDEEERSILLGMSSHKGRQFVLELLGQPRTPGTPGVQPREGAAELLRHVRAGAEGFLEQHHKYLEETEPIYTTRLLLQPSAATGLWLSGRAVELDNPARVRMRLEHLKVSPNATNIAQWKSYLRSVRGLNRDTDEEAPAAHLFWRSSVSKELYRCAAAWCVAPRPPSPPPPPYTLSTHQYTCARSQRTLGRRAAPARHPVFLRLSRARVLRCVAHGHARAWARAAPHAGWACMGACAQG